MVEAHMDERQLKRSAAEIRKLTISAMAAAGLGHIGGSMSICELLAALYGGILEVDPQNPTKPDRDWLVLSKGHCGPALYAALACRGYFDKKLMLTLNANGTSLPSHCDRLKTRGIDLSAGSLGQGVSLAIGAALGCRMRGYKNHVFCVMGDGEMQEGQVWEGLQFAAHRKLGNLVFVIDDNKRQIDGYTRDICDPLDMGAKLAAFGFEVLRADGKDCGAIYEALLTAKNAGKPIVVILDTEKGQGCSFAETADFNHYMVIDQAMADEANREVDRRLGEG
jgi:transketolase